MKHPQPTKVHETMMNVNEAKEVCQNHCVCSLYLPQWEYGVRMYYKVRTGMSKQCG